MNRPRETVVVGLNVEIDRKTGKAEVSGVLAVFGDNPVRFKNLEALAEVLAHHDYEILGLPLEEGWDGALDLPALARRKLDRLIADIRSSNDVMHAMVERDWARMNSPLFAGISRALEPLIPDRQPRRFRA